MSAGKRVLAPVAPPPPIAASRGILAPLATTMSDMFEDLLAKAIEFQELGDGSAFEQLAQLGDCQGRRDDLDGARTMLQRIIANQRKLLATTSRAVRRTEVLLDATVELALTLLVADDGLAASATLDGAEKGLELITQHSSNDSFRRRLLVARCQGAHERAKHRADVPASHHGEK